MMYGVIVSEPSDIPHVRRCCSGRPSLRHVRRGKQPAHIRTVLHTRSTSGATWRVDGHILSSVGKLHFA